MSVKGRKRHSPEQVVRKLRDADALLNSGKDLAAVLHRRGDELFTDCPFKKCVSHD